MRYLGRPIHRSVHRGRVGCSEENVQLLRATRPPIRDPLDVSEAKTAGRVADAETTVDDSECGLNKVVFVRAMMDASVSALLSLTV